MARSKNNFFLLSSDISSLVFPFLYSWRTTTYDKHSSLHCLSCSKIGRHAARKETAPRVFHRPPAPHLVLFRSNPSSKQFSSSIMIWMKLNTLKFSLPSQPQQLPNGSDNYSPLSCNIFPMILFCVSTLFCAQPLTCSPKLLTSAIFHRSRNFPSRPCLESSLLPLASPPKKPANPNDLKPLLLCSIPRLGRLSDHPPRARLSRVPTQQPLTRRKLCRPKFQLSRYRLEWHLQPQAQLTLPHPPPPQWSVPARSLISLVLPGKSGSL